MKPSWASTAMPTRLDRARPTTAAGTRPRGYAILAESAIVPAQSATFAAMPTTAMASVRPPISASRYADTCDAR